jgi:uncharacterized membrane protein YsdA (DUF1294 family)/cold shock CspA family protein
MRYQGRIATWKDERGFGFIAPDGGGKPVFVHVSSFKNRQRRPKGDELVTYQIGVDSRGRLRAEAVAYVDERLHRSGGPGRSSFPPLFAACFLFSVGAAVLFGWLPLAVLVLYLAASVLTFVVYAMDKSAAVQHEWRTAESTLHLFSLLGGWPGAVAAQRLLRHKCSKESFQVAFWITVVLNCVAVGWLISPYGAELRHSVLAASRELLDAFTDRGPIDSRIRW